MFWFGLFKPNRVDGEWYRMNSNASVCYMADDLSLFTGSQFVPGFRTLFSIMILLTFLL